METKEIYHKADDGKVYKVNLLPIDAAHAALNHPHQWSMTPKFAKDAPQRAEAVGIVGAGAGILQGGLGVIGEAVEEDAEAAPARRR